MKKHALVTTIIFALFPLFPFVLAGCPKKSGDASDAAAEAAAEPVDTTPSAAPSETAHVDVKVGCKPGDTLLKVKGVHGVEGQCHHPCKGDSECPKDRPFCFGKTVVETQGYCQTLKESQPKCKPGEKLVQVGGVMFECWVGVCKTDADCHAPSKCMTDADGWDPDKPDLHYHPCSRVAAGTPSASPSAGPPTIPSALPSPAGKLVAPADQPFTFPNPKHLPCPAPYVLAGDNCQMK